VKGKHSQVTSQDEPHSDQKPAARILLIEDRVSLKEMLAEFLQEKGFDVVSATTAQDGQNAYNAGYFHLALIDLKLPDGSGLDVLKAIRKIRPSQPVILMTAYGTIQESVKAIKMGAEDFIQKPIDLNHLHHLIQRSIEFHRLQTEVLLYREEFRRNQRLPDLISRSPVMKDLALHIQKIAVTDATVLLTGESGTGKELFARSIHLLSSCKTGPFVEVNCAAIPDTLMENELFGHMRGAYTGADTSAKGKFELASGGTLFLDEIAEMAVPVQSKLLKALEEKKITPIGGSLPISVDVRIVAATNRDLDIAVQNKTFRSDLFYRLAQFPVHIPPLRERQQDILPLVRHFLTEIVGRTNRPLPEVSERAQQILFEQRWPGNVRELKNLVERAVIVDEDGVIDVDDLFPGYQMQNQSIESISLEDVTRLGLERWLRGRAESLEKAAISQLMDKIGRDRSQLAEALKISQRTLSSKLKKYFSDSPQEE